MQKFKQEFSFKKLFVPLTTLKAIHIFIIIGFIVFGNMLFNDFVWDDTESIVNNKMVHSISNIGHFFAGSTFNSGGQGSLVGLYYKPVITTIFSFIYTFFGGNPFFYHLLQVSIHIANAILIFIFLRYFLSNLLSFFLSMIFLVHPMNVESVSYISSLEDPLFFLFGMLALHLIKSNTLKSKANFFVAFFLLLSVLSKESGFIFVIVSFIYVLFFKNKDLYRYLFTILPVIIVYSLLRFVIAKIYFSAPPVFAMTRLPLLERMKSIPEMTFFYIKNFFYPKDLAIAQDWTILQITFQNFYLPLIIALLFFTGIFSFGFYLWKKKDKMFKLFLFFCLLSLLSLGIHIQIVPLDLTVADRWFYLPMVGLLGIIGILLQKIKISKPYIKVFVFMLATILICILSIRTMIRNGDWKNESTLYRHDIQVNRNSYELESNYGLVLLREGKIDEGQTRLLRSTKLAPYRWSGWTNLGASYEMKKDYTNARKFYEIAISKGPYYSAYENYAKLLLFHDTPQNAQVFSKKAVKTFPYNSNSWLFLAVAEYKLGNKQEALEAAHRSYSLSPNEDNHYVYFSLIQNLPIELK